MLGEEVASVVDEVEVRALGWDCVAGARVAIALADSVSIRSTILTLTSISNLQTKMARHDLHSWWHKRRPKFEYT